MSKQVYLQALEAKVKKLEENLKQLKAEIEEFKISPQGEGYSVELQPGFTNNHPKMEEEDYEEGWAENDDDDEPSKKKEEWISKVESKNEKLKKTAKERSRPSKGHEKYKRRMSEVRQIFDKGKKLMEDNGEFEFVLMKAKLKFKICGNWLNKVYSGSYEFKNNKEKQEFLEFQKQVSQSELDCIRRLKRFNRNENEGKKDAKEGTMKKEEEEAESGRKLNSIVEKFYNYWHSKENVKTLMKEKEDILSLATVVIKTYMTLYTRLFSK